MGLPRVRLTKTERANNTLTRNNDIQDRRVRLTMHFLNKSFKLHEVLSLHENWAEPEVGKGR